MTDSLVMYGVLPDGWADADVEEITAQPMPEPGLAPFWWETHPVNVEAAHEATLVMGKGQR